MAAVAERHGAKAVLVDTAEDMADPDVKADRAAVVQEVLADVRAGSANISARRRFASFASRRWTLSITSARTFFRSSCKNAERFCRGV